MVGGGSVTVRRPRRQVVGRRRELAPPPEVVDAPVPRSGKNRNEEEEFRHQRGGALMERKTPAADALAAG